MQTTLSAARFHTTLIVAIPRNGLDSLGYWTSIAPKVVSEAVDLKQIIGAAEVTANEAMKHRYRIESEPPRTQGAQAIPIAATSPNVWANTEATFRSTTVTGPPPIMSWTNRNKS